MRTINTAGSDDSMTWLTLIFLLSLLLRLPAAIYSPPTIIYNVDELEVLRNALGLLMGQTPSGLQWPAGITLFILTPAIFLHFIFTSPSALASLTALDPNGFITGLTTYIGKSFYNPLPLLIIGRTMIAVVTAATPVLAVISLNDYLKKSEKITVAIVIATSPLLVGETVFLKGDSIGLMFWTASFFFLLRFITSDSFNYGLVRLLYTGFFFLGLASASRFTFCAIFPILLIVISVKLFLFYRKGFLNKKAVSRLFLFSLFAFLTPLLIFVPFVWTHMITTAKSFVGNLLYLSQNVQAFPARAVLLKSILDATGLPAFSLVVTGCWASWRQKGFMTSVVLLSSFLFFFIPLFQAKYVEPRYTLVFLPVLSLWTGVGLSAFLQWAGKRFRSGPGLVFGLLLLIIAAWNCFQIANWFSIINKPNDMVRASEWLKSNSSSEDAIATPKQFGTLIPPDRQAVTRILNNYELNDDSVEKRLTGLMKKIGRQETLSDDSPDFAINALFGQDEALALFHYRTMLYALKHAAPSDSARNIWYYAKEPETSDCIPYDVAVQLFRSGRVKFLTTREEDGALKSEGFSPAIKFSSWHVYMNNGTTHK